MTLPVKTKIVGEVYILIQTIRVCSSMDFNLGRVEKAINNNTVNSSLVLDGLWQALPKWTSFIKQNDLVLRNDKSQALVREMANNSALDLGVALDKLIPAVDDLVAAIRNHPILFNTDGMENNTICDEGGERKSVVYSQGELNDLLPYIISVRSLFLR